MSNKRTIGNGDRYFEPQSSDEDDTGALSPNNHTTSTGGYITSTDFTCIGFLHTVVEYAIRKVLRPQTFNNVLKLAKDKRFETQVVQNIASKRLNSAGVLRMDSEGVGVHLENETSE
ncbi:hypothetical protein TNCV_731351 [Trichonephila clavipes]|nr:hypothetical protein TNCV_731351 [Trichonephila clavipes]